MSIGEFIWGMGQILGKNDILFQITCVSFTLIILQ